MILEINEVKISYKSFVKVDRQNVGRFHNFLGKWRADLFGSSLWNLPQLYFDTHNLEEIQ